MRKIIRNCLFILAFFVLMLPVTVRAANGLRANKLFNSAYKNSSTSYEAVIDDEAELIPDDKEKALTDVMKEITGHANIALITTTRNPYGDSAKLVQKCNEELFTKNGPGVVLLIDMAERKIMIDSSGSARRTITVAYADTISDNIYRLASNKKYDQCALKGLQQISSLFKGERIAQPMKHISNALLALVLAALINFFIVMRMSKKHKPSNSELVEGVFSKCNVYDPAAVFTHQTRTYSPISSGSSGGSSGGGGGGGGHSTGGHSF